MFFGPWKYNTFWFRPLFFLSKFSNILILVPAISEPPLSACVANEATDTCNYEWDLHLPHKPLMETH